MSHFTVLVLGENIDEQMKPFKETSELDGFREYLEFSDVTEIEKKRYEEDSVKSFHCYSGSSWGKEILPMSFRMIKSSNIGENIVIGHECKACSSLIKGEIYRCYASGTKKRPTDDELVWIKVLDVIATTSRDADICTDGAVRVEIIAPPQDVRLKDMYPSFEEYMSSYSYEIDEETGRYGYWENPNAKWDWYTIGGRWSGVFRVKQGKEGLLGKKSWTNEDVKLETNQADQAKKCDIDFKSMYEEEFKKHSNLYDEFEELLKSDPERARNDSYWEYGIENISTTEDWVPESRDQYIAKRSEFATFAVLIDGKWYERGSMGWWGVVSDEKDHEGWHKEFNKLLDSLDDNTLMTVLDCHI